MANVDQEVSSGGKQNLVGDILSAGRPFGAWQPQSRLGENFYAVHGDRSAAVKGAKNYLAFTEERAARLRQQVATLAKQKKQLSLKNSLLKDLVEYRDVRAEQILLWSKGESEVPCPVCCILAGEDSAFTFSPEFRERWNWLKYAVADQPAVCRGGPLAPGLVERR